MGWRQVVCVGCERMCRYRDFRSDEIPSWCEAHDEVFHESRQLALQGVYSRVPGRRQVLGVRHAVKRELWEEQIRYCSRRLFPRDAATAPLADLQLEAGDPVDVDRYLARIREEAEGLNWSLDDSWLWHDDPGELEGPADELPGPLAARGSAAKPAEPWPEMFGAD